VTETAEKLKVELLQLSTQERAELAYFLLHSLEEEAEPDVESAWDAELTSRMQEIDDGTASGQSADQVFAELRKKYS